MQVQTTPQFDSWMDGLRDRQGRARIMTRIRRLAELGNPGQHRVLKGGVLELKIDVGPGYRVYVTRRGEELLLLLVGGDKSTQDRDIETAFQLAKEYE
jgi:putative addiction module killer protein